MNENGEKIVRYDLYCNTCKHYIPEDEKGLQSDVCNECLNNPVNANSKKPINYRKKEK